MDMKTDFERLEKSCSFSDKDCCSVEKSTINGANANKVSDLSLSLEQVNAITFFIISKYLLFESSSNKANFYRDYSPPKVTKNIAILYQTFII